MITIIIIHYQYDYHQYDYYDPRLLVNVLL